MPDLWTPDAHQERCANIKKLTPDRVGISAFDACLGLQLEVSLPCG
jgi:hypothetical protein